jgi:predicted extracellular nuclease
VTFDAYLTMEGLLAANFKDNAGKGAISVASAPGAWNGVWILANPSSLATLHEGDLVTVTGKVDDDHEGYWAYQTNTYIVGTVVLKINEFPIGTTPVTLADLEADPESFEGVLVEISDDAGISSVNPYDVTLSDGISSFLIDDDLVEDSIFDINYEENAVVGGVDTVVVGDTLSNVKGVVMYGYGSIKIEVRKLDDITVKPRVVEPGIADVPDNFVLHQNYPNPFNPVTTIRFDLAKATDVKLTIYDISGRRIQELVNSSMNAGSYDLRFNAGHLSSGMYLYRIETPEFTATNKLLLLK